MDRKPETSALQHELALERENDRLRRTIDLLDARYCRLEEENGRLVGMLNERGVPVRTRSQTAMELPAPPSVPLEPEGEALALLSSKERTLLEETLGLKDLFLVVRSDTRVDVGGWFRRPAVWVCAANSRLATLAWGPRPWVEMIDYAYLQESLYNHVTGELVLAPAMELKLKALFLSPLNGYELLALIYHWKESAHD